MGLGLGIGLGLVLGLGLGVGLALGLGWVRFYMLQSQSAHIKASLWRRIPRKNKRRQKILGNRPLILLPEIREWDGRGKASEGNVTAQLLD